MVYYGNNIYDEKSYKIAIRKTQSEFDKNKNVNATYTNENENENENEIDNVIEINDKFNQKNLVNISKAYKFFKQKKLEEYEASDKIYSESDLEKHIQRAWKNSPENPLNQTPIKENMKFSSKHSLKKISNEKKKILVKILKKFLNLI
ncbi:hypothetical protein LY90DRAFT_514213 [Neocallimastix californiae]|uniref:Coiled-coil domain-containing protein n=1 Tax=Neocallimastix californiae TaxID=1754190 RepID=A0A1Y2AS40_9FUNG|nr:hypothetical protein LY90DRAFT_514213 [Neocallimastix californiae]|eukprot:ORY25296.1 hypothetical protein LY90DRAFT_514213 [Neocallimastix californiae]